MNSVAARTQFVISSHYDVMAQLDEDVHRDDTLSASEVDVALRLIGHIPKRVFLPCFGTARHVSALLEAGVESIVGVDLSPVCVQKGLDIHRQNRRVSLSVGNVLEYKADVLFDAVLLLGNSFGDVVDPDMFQRITAAFVAPLKPGGTFVMDYIGDGYLSQVGRTTTWDAMLDGRPVKDQRTPHYDNGSRVMTIEVVACDPQTCRVVWEGYYQKRILHQHEVVAEFDRCRVKMVPHGQATALNPSYYGSSTGELGMILKSIWWKGVKQ